MRNLILLAALALLTTACNQGCICVQSEYITYEDLASYVVGTPDPRKECPDTGQRLLVRWDLPNRCYVPGETTLMLTVRFSTGEEEIIDLDLHAHKGRYIYDLLNDDYFDRCGILTYKAEVAVCGEIVSQWFHQIWTDRIVFEESCPLCEEPEDFTSEASSVGHIPKET